MRASLTFPTLIVCFSVSTSIAIFIPILQLGGTSPFVKEEDNQIVESYPQELTGLARVGKEVFISEGCQSCHTQIVRGGDAGDSKRGWGNRRSVARDYIFERNVPFGLVRLGPDLASYGADNWKSDYKKPKDNLAEWHYKHLYSPDAVDKYTIMPSYRHLFKELKEKDVRPNGTLIVDLDGKIREIIPTERAKALVSYLVSRNQSYPLSEAGEPIKAAAK